MIVRTGIAAFVAALLAFGDADAQISPGPSFAPPPGAISPTGLVFTSTSPVTIASSIPTSVFPPGSAAARTVAVGALPPGRQFGLVGGGIYSAPVANTLTATISLKVGAATVVSVTTPAVLVATNQGVDFHAECVVQAGGTTIICTGTFLFVVLGSGPVVVPFNSVVPVTFDPTVPDTIDVLGNWNGTVTTQATTVQTASLWVRN